MGPHNEGPGCHLLLASPGAIWEDHGGTALVGLGVVIMGTALAGLGTAVPGTSAVGSAGAGRTKKGFGERVAILLLSHPLKSHAWLRSLAAWVLNRLSCGVRQGVATGSGGGREGGRSHQRIVKHWPTEVGRGLLWRGGHRAWEHKHDRHQRWPVTSRWAERSASGIGRADELCNAAFLCVILDCQLLATSKKTAMKMDLSSVTP